MKYSLRIEQLNSLIYSRKAMDNGCEPDEEKYVKQSLK